MSKTPIYKITDLLWNMTQSADGHSRAAIIYLFPTTPQSRIALLHRPRMQLTSLVDNTYQRLALVRLGKILPVETDRNHGSD